VLLDRVVVEMHRSWDVLGLVGSTELHPAAYLHNKFPDTIVRYLILIISSNGIPQNTKIVMTRY
jgi:hypothetical protein